MIGGRPSLRLPSEFDPVPFELMRPRLPSTLRSLPELLANPRSDAPLWGVAASTLLIALGLAGAHPAALAVTGLLFAASALHAWRGASSASIPAPGMLAFALAAYSLIQALPLPLLLLRIIDPNAADVWSRALYPFKEQLAWGALSLDPGASLREAFKWSLYGLAFVCAGVVTDRHGRHVCALLVFVPALIVAIVTLTHGVLGATRVFGIYSPTFKPSPWQLGPFVNPNNLSGYLNLAAFTGLGLVVSDKLVRYRALLAIGVALLFAVSILSGSRGGVWMLPAGLAVFLVLMYRDTRRRSPRRRGSRGGRLALLAVIASGVAFAALGATQTTWTQLFNDNIEKLGIVSWALPTICDYPLFGIGRGAFESVFPAYMTPARNAVYSHPENFIVQWLTEWGIPVGAGALLTFAWWFRPRRGSGYGSRLGSGIAVGAGLVLLQNLVDLGLEIPAVGLSMSLALGTLWYSAPREQRLGRWSLSAPPLVGRVFSRLAIGLACIWLLLLTDLGWQVSLERQALHEAASTLDIKDAEALAAFRKRLRSAMLRHPADPYFPRLGASVALSARDQDPMPWLQRALERGEASARSHLLTAEALQRRGAVAQALLELRKTAELEERLAQHAGRLAVAWSGNVEQVLKVAPNTTTGAVVLTAAAAAWNKPDSARERERLLRAAVQRDHSSVSARLGLGRLLVERVDQGTCPPSPCVHQALEQANAVLATAPVLGAIELRSDALVRIERWQDAQRAFVDLCPRLEGTELAKCWFSRLLLAQKKPGASSAEISGLAKQAAEAACAALGQCAGWLREAGDTLRANGDTAGALNHYERAVQQSPSASLMLRIADTASALGLLARADAALGRAAQLGSGDPEQGRQIAARRQELRMEMLKQHGSR